MQNGLTSFSPARAEELALLASPLVNDISIRQKQTEEKVASERLLGIAKILMGRR